MTLYFLTLDPIFAMSKGARNDNVFPYFGVNSKGAKMTTYLLTLESLFVNCLVVQKMALYLRTLESVFVLSKGANDNVFTNFGVNLCNVLRCKE